MVLAHHYLARFFTTAFEDLPPFPAASLREVSPLRLSLSTTHQCKRAFLHSLVRAQAPYRFPAELGPAEARENMGYYNHPKKKKSTVARKKKITNLAARCRVAAEAIGITAWTPSCQGTLLRSSFWPMGLLVWELLLPPRR